MKEKYYLIRYTQKEVYGIPVKAISRKEALEIFWDEILDKLFEEETLNNYHYDSEGDCEIEEELTKEEYEDCV